MTPTATYIAEENCLQEQLPPELEPAIHDANAHPELYDEYKACVATLRKIPCDTSCKGLWAGGQKVVEGRDYEVREMPAPRPEPIYETEEDWKQAQYEDRHELTQYVKKIPTAFPLVPVKSEDELWEEVEKLITVNSHWQIPEILRIVKMLKSKYSLTKR